MINGSYVLDVQT